MVVSQWSWVWFSKFNIMHQYFDTDSEILGCSSQPSLAAGKLCSLGGVMCALTLVCARVCVYRCWMRWWWTEARPPTCPMWTYTSMDDSSPQCRETVRHTRDPVMRCHSVVSTSRLISSQTILNWSRSNKCGQCPPSPPPPCPLGVIVSTPTGSTAYAAAAGASMIHPNVPAIMVTPICPHSLSFRPIVVPAGVELMVRMKGRRLDWAVYR